MEYDENGKKVYEGGFNGFNRNGNGYCFNVDGKDMEYCLYENGRLKRVIQMFKGNEMTENDANGKRVYVGGYAGDIKNGFVRNGEGKEMDGNGNVIYTGEWKNGKRYGEGKEMDESGRIVFVGEWMNGKGKGKEMDEDGKAVYEGEWWNGKRNGSGKEMDASGRVVFVGEWKNGKKNGEFYELDGNGIVVRISLYENSAIKRHGDIRKKNHQW